MSNDEWKALVQKGKQAATADRGGAAFELGDLALAVEPVGGEGTHTGGLDRLAKYAAAVEVPFNTLRGYRQVAAAWPADIRDISIPWRVHQALASEPDRAVLIRNGTQSWAAAAALKVERHPRLAPKRDERWWTVQQESLRQLRGWDKKRIAHLPTAEARRRAKFMRELAALDESVASQLEAYGNHPDKI